MSEALAQIVNDKDEVVGHKPRREIDHAQETYRVAALWVTNSNGDVLLAQRAMEKELDAGKWGPAVAGTLEGNETYEDNIYQESDGEIGLSGVKFQEGPKFHVDAPRKLFVQYFTVTLDRPAESFRMQEGEVMGIRWFSRDELMRLLQERPDDFTYSVGHMLSLNPENT